MTDARKAPMRQPSRRSSDASVASTASLGRALDMAEIAVPSAIGCDASGPDGVAGDRDGGDELLVLVCTANMGNAKPNEESIGAWLPKGGRCRDVLEEDGHAMDDATGGGGTEAVRASVLKRTNGEGGGSSPSVLDERCFDVIVIGMQEATFSTKKTAGRNKSKDGAVGESAATDRSSLSASMSPLTSVAMAKAERPDYDSEDDEDESTVAEGATKNAATAAMDKVAKGVDNFGAQVSDGAKAVGSEMKALGTNVGNAVLTPIVMMAGSGGTTTKDREHTVFSEKMPPLMVEAAEALNPTEWALGTKELKDAIARRLGRGYRFHVRCQRGEMRLFVLVRTDFAGGRIDVGDVYAENTGIGQVMANKGGMVVTLSVGDDTRLSFMTAHLEAHEGKDHYEGRCRNVEGILMGARPGLNKKLGVGVNAGVDISPKPSRGFYDATVLSHHSFVCGDLNFRVALPSGVPGGVGTLWEGRSKEDHRKKVRQMVENERWDDLNKADELFHALRVGDCLTGFKTPQCRFHPTFKVEREEGFNYIRKRSPSYTDRILWKSVYGLEQHVRPLAYGPIPAFSTSDHKPMRGAFAVKLNCDAGGRSSPARPQAGVGKQQPQGSAQESILHLFVTDIRCTGLPEMRSHMKRTDPYIVFVADPLDILRFDRSKMDKMLMRVGITRNKTKKDKSEGTKTKLRSGWPRTPVVEKSRDPDWGEYEAHLKINRGALYTVGTKGDGGERLGIKGAMLYLTVMNYDGAGDQLIGTVALSLPTLCGECKAGFDAKRRRDPNDKSSNHDSDALPFDVIDIDEPIVRYGKEQGRLKCTITPWNLEGGDNDLFSKRKDVKTRETKRKSKVKSKVKDCVTS